MSLFRMCLWAAVGLWLAASALTVLGCKQGPRLTKERAVALIQAELDKEPPVSAIIRVNDDGMKVGVVAHYWDRSKAYPNHYWADFKLTDTGKKAVALPDGGDTILWHPDSPTDVKYAITLSPVQASHLKAADALDPQKGVDGTRTMVFSEVASLDGVPAPVQEMARDSRTKVSTQHTATFVLQNGAWKLESIE